jgi:hypoxanthine phosphoribosyltransferase
MARRIKVNGDTFTLLISERRLQARVRALARQISKEYRGSVPVFIGVLNGSFMFLADLIREVTVPCEVDFLKLSSYGDAKISSGNVRLLKDLNCKVEGRDIIVVEDIVDSGLSMQFIREMIGRQNPRSLRVVTLLYKKGSVRTAVPLEYIGFTLGADYVIGYGLDYAQRERNLSAIYRQVPDTAPPRSRQAGAQRWSSRRSRRNSR